MGEAAPTATGSTIQAKAFSTGLGPAINATTNSGSLAQGFSSPAANYKTGKNLTFFCIGWLNAIATERAWFGITDQDMSTMEASDNPAGNYAAFRYSNGIGVTDTSWQCITKDGSTQNIIASGVAPVIGVFQKFLIIFNDAAATITFYINDVLVGTSSSHLPTAATSVNWVMGSFTTSSGSFQNGIALNQLIVMTDI
jgi:hypothetical protein